MDKIIKRGYVKWTDEDGVFHKEPLVDHPELLAEATPQQQLQAEEVRRLNAAAEEFVAAREEENKDTTQEVLAELKKAPEEVLTAAQLTDEAPMSGAEDNGEKTPEVESLQFPAAEATEKDKPLVLEPPVSEDFSNEHQQALEELREKTSD